MKNWNILKTETDYRNALTRLDEVIDATMGTSEGDELELLALLIKDYQEKHYPRPLKPPLFNGPEEVKSSNKDYINSINLQGVVENLKEKIIDHDKKSDYFIVRAKWLLFIILFVIVFADYIVKMSRNFLADKGPVIHTTIVKRRSDSLGYSKDTTTIIDSPFVQKSPK